MSLTSYLENLRAKPEHVRKRYAFLTSFGITAVIFMFWLGSFSNIRNSSSNAIATAVSRIDSPSHALVASVGSFFTDIKDIVFGPKKVKYTSVVVTPGRK